jgi:hypothetical protein
MGALSLKKMVSHAIVANQVVSKRSLLHSALEKYYADNAEKPLKLKEILERHEAGIDPIATATSRDYLNILVVRFLH